LGVRSAFVGVPSPFDVFFSPRHTYCSYSFSSFAGKIQTENAMPRERRKTISTRWNVDTDPAGRRARERAAAPVTVLGEYRQRRFERADGATPAQGQDRRASLHAANGTRWHARQNRLLAALPAADYERLWPLLELVALPLGEPVCDAGCQPTHALFPVSGIVSFTQELASGALAEVAVSGNEGMAGVELVLGGVPTTRRAFVRNTGSGYRLRGDVLQAEFDRCRPFRQALLRHSQLVLAQAAQIAVCRGHHSIDEQVCRFLLATLDRSPGDEVALTQELIAQLLGVRRESVTVAAGALQAAGAIRYHRGRIAVLDRGALEARACECYATLRHEAARLTPEADRSALPSTLFAPRVAHDCALGAHV
jgi:CRP-like cAMP-binding protein